MQIQKRKILNKKLIILIASLVLVGAGVLSYFLISNQQRKDTLGIGQPAESDKRQAEQLAENPDNKSESVNTDQTPALDSDESTGKSVIPMVASVSSAQDSILVRGGLNNVVVTQGECYALLTGPNGESIKKPTELLQNASTTDCKTITINRSELSSGTWAVTLQYTSDDAQGTSDDIEIKI